MSRFAETIRSEYPDVRLAPTKRLAAALEAAQGRATSGTWDSPEHLLSKVELEEARVLHGALTRRPEGTRLVVRSDRRNPRKAAGAYPTPYTEVEVVWERGAWTVTRLTRATTFRILPSVEVTAPSASAAETLLDGDRAVWHIAGAA